MLNEVTFLLLSSYVHVNIDSSSDEPTVSELPTPTPEQPSQPIAEPSDSSVDAEPSAPSVDADNNNLLYGGLIVFIAVLVVCLVLYLAYHNKDKVHTVTITSLLG